MNRLAHNRCYLCGAIENTTDFGTSWRDYIKKELESLKILFLDPCDKPINVGFEDREKQEYWKKCKEDGCFDILSSEMRTIRCVDLRMCDISDFIIMNYDNTIHTVGTYEEIFWANRGKKPILIRCAQGKEHCSGWLFGTIPHEMIFSTWEEVVKYVKHIAHDKEINTLKRWFFFNFTGE